MLNKTQIIGYIGQDPEAKQFENSNLASFSVATTERFKDRAGKRQEKTEWHRVVAWGKTGDFVAKYLSKGRLVYVEGKMQYRKYTDKDGNEKTAAEIVASTVQALGKEGRTDTETSTEKDNVDDIPF